MRSSWLADCTTSGFPEPERMLKEFKVDLHIHTCLSPCGDNSMVPTKIIAQAKRGNLHAIGISDHNATENVLAVREAGLREGVPVLGGIEMTSEEEIHVLAFFDDHRDLAEMQNLIYENLEGENDEEAWGEQIIVDSNDRITGSNKRLLIGATGLSIDRIVDHVHKLGGIAIASHVDKEAFSITSQLGFIPQFIELDALELSPHASNSRISYRDSGFPLLTFSDAHYLDDLGSSFTTLMLAETTVEELKKAITETEGRQIIL